MKLEKINNIITCCWNIRGVAIHSLTLKDEESLDKILKNVNKIIDMVDREEIDDTIEAFQYSVLDRTKLTRKEKKQFKRMSKKDLKNCKLGKWEVDNGEKIKEK